MTNRTAGADAATGAPTSSAPPWSGLVVIALILAAAVANLAVADVALPNIGKEFDASQTALNLVAVGCSLGLAASVLYLGALGHRFGRKLVLILVMVLLVPVYPLGILVGAALAFVPFPRKREEEDLLGRYDNQDTAVGVGAGDASLADAAGAGSVG